MAYILAVDDEPDVLDSVKEVLEDAGQDIITANSGAKALEILAEQSIDLVVLDIIMPDMDGVEVCRRIRANPLYSRIPILFLTAMGRSKDVALGLDIGGDDYLVKPYDIIELPARVRALLRRTPNNTLDQGIDFISYGDLKLSLAHPRVEIKEISLTLTPTEHRVLHYLIQHAEKPVSPERLLQDVWEYPSGVGDPQLARVHINNLRSKLEDAGCTYLTNVHGQGYLIQK